MVIIETKSKTARIRDSSGEHQGGGGSGGAGGQFETVDGKTGYASSGVSQITDESGNIIFTAGGGGSSRSQPVGISNIQQSIANPVNIPSPSSNVVKYGDITVAKTDISPGIARQLAGANPLKPYDKPQGFSMRDDIPYNVTSRRVNTPAPRQSNAGDQAVISTFGKASGGGKPQGTVSRVQPKTENNFIARQTSDRAEQYARELAYTSEFKSEGFKRQALGTAAFTLNFLAQGSRYITQPVQSFIIKPYQFAKTFISNPKKTVDETGYQVGRQLESQPGLFISGAAGEAAAFKFLPFVVKQSKKVTFIGKEEIPVEQIVEPQILSGEKRFPSSSQSAPALVNEFKNSPFQDVIKSKTGVVEGGFSASPSSLKTFWGVGRGTSATPGLYIAPSVSKYFLKLSSESSDPSFSIFPKLGTPTINYIETPVGLIPKSLVREAEAASGIKIGAGGQRELGGKPVSIGNKYTPAGITALKKLNTYFDTSEGSIYGSGKAVITPEYYLGKGEKEALVGMGSGLKTQRPGSFWDKITGFKYYSTVDGERVPIKIITAQDLEGGSFVKQVTSRAENLLTRRSIASSYGSGRPNVSLVGSASKVGSVVGGFSSRVPISSGNLYSGFSSRRVLRGSSSSGVFSTTIIGGGRSELVSPRPGSSIINRPSRSITTPSSRSTTYQPYTPYYVPSKTLITPYYTPRGGRGNGTPPPPTYRPSIKRNDNAPLYDVELRRYGSFKTVGTGLKLGEAKLKGIGAAKGTLGATFRLRRSGGGQVIPTIAPSGFYNKGELVIQRRGFRLSSSGEIREIGLAKKKRKKNNLGF